MKSIYRLVRESGVSAASIVVISMLACISSLLAVLPPHFLGAAINSIIGDEISSQTIIFSPINLLNVFLSWLIKSVNISPVNQFLTLFFISSLICLIIRNVYSVYVSIYADRFILFIRKKCFYKLLRSERTALKQFESGDLVHRVMNDTQQLDFIIGHPLYTLCSDILDLIWISVIIIMIDWKIFLILILIIPFLYLISNKTGRVQRACAALIQQNEALCTGFIQRAVLGIDTIKAYQGERKELDAFSALNDANFNVRKKASINLGLFFPQEGALRVLGTISVITYVAFLAANDVAYVGTIPVLLVYTGKFYAPLSNWAKYYQSIQRGLVSYRRLLDILAVEEETVALAPTVSIESVLPFKAEGAILLDKGSTVPLSVEVSQPSLIILQGKSGIGKTRLIKSLIGLGCDFRGEINFGKMHIINGPQDNRNYVAIASQDGHFVPGTLAENLSYPSTEIDEEKCFEILNDLQLGYGLAHPVTEYGRNLSIGEQRRVIFGRALYSDKPVMLLDEIDANVDAETRIKLYQIIRREMAKRLIIMVSHIHTSEFEGKGVKAVMVTRKTV